jgi:rhamnopyranosyl-N-acetylglucosaminyl-diphospho-decaprenol beta-1,3/1,4-galactofuranosyltransferase
MKRAYEDGYDWIWVMDDDAEPDPRCLELLLASGVEEAGFLAPLIVTPEGTPEAYHHKRYARHFFVREVSPDSFVPFSALDSDALIPLDANAFVGPLISRGAVRTAGLPDPGFFILWDDVEYTYRISRKLKSYLVPKARILHKDRTTAAKAAYAGKSDWKVYYATRNSILFVRVTKGIIRCWLYALDLAGRAAYDAARCRVSRKPHSNDDGCLHLRLWAAWDGIRNNKVNRITPPSLRSGHQEG